MENPSRATRTLRFGSFELDAAAQELREDGRPRKLSAQPFRILVLLTDRAGQIVSRQEIRQCLWGDRKYVEVDRGINFCMNQIRSALRDPAEAARYIRTLPRQGYTFVAPLTEVQQPPLAPAPEVPVQAAPVASSPVAFRRPPRYRSALAGISLVVVSAILVRDANLAAPPSGPMPRNTVVIAEFSNTTGDAVFDDTLSQALLIELQESPVLEVLAESKVQQTMKLMGRSPGQHVTPDVAREMCLRSGGDALVHGAISRVGSHYVVNLRATACGAGSVLGNEQRDVAHKEQVLDALSRAAAHLRTGLGESLRSVQRLDVPDAETTISLDALQNYSRGIKILKEQGEAPSIPFFKRALELDPAFAMAYAALAARYNNLGQPGEALTYAAKAYELRDRVSERERLTISSRYLRLTGELEKMTQVLDMWISEFPNAGNPHGSLGVNYMMLGQFTKALPELQAAMRLSPDTLMCYENLSSLYIDLNQPEEAEKTLKAAFGRGMDGGDLRLARYYLAFIENDEAQMQRQVEWSEARPGGEHLMVSAQADTEAYFGRLTAARALSRRAVDSAERSGYPESAALWQVIAALREAEFGEQKEAIDDAGRALRIAAGRNVEELAALAFARAGDAASAAVLISQIEDRYARDTMAMVYRLPVIKAAVALSQGNPRLALDVLEPVRPYDLARPSPGLALMYPAFLRGHAYLALGDAHAAALEFQQVVEQRGLTRNFALGVLARLELAKAYDAAGETARSKDAYTDLAAIWKRSDSNVLALLTAKTPLASAPPPFTERIPERTRMSGARAYIQNSKHNRRS